MRDRHARHPQAGRLLLARAEDPKSAKGRIRTAEGERRLGALLDTIAGPEIAVLHDRRVSGTRATIDHLVIAPSGIWVVDAKHDRGEVAIRDVGGWIRSVERLYVGGRDCSGLVARMARQVDATIDAVDGRFDAVRITPVLCFVESEWRRFGRPFVVDGVVIASPSALLSLISTSSTNSVPVAQIAQTLAAALPSAH